MQTTMGETQFSRRDLLLGALGLTALGATALSFSRSFSEELFYRDLPGLAPFQELASDGGISTASSAFIGFQGDPSEPNAQLEDRIAEVQADPCSALFGASVSPNVVPLAYFSDFNCPNCRVLENVLATVMADDEHLVLVRHELPLLGEASASAAKAVLAADLQGGYEVMKARLLRAGLITDEPYLRAVAGPLGLNADQLLADMGSAQVADRLLRSTALGKVFGFYGTPALVVGRTVILGSMSAGTLRQVIRDERSMPVLAC